MNTAQHMAELDAAENTKPTLHTLVSCDVARVIAHHLDYLNDVASLWLCLLPFKPKALHEAVIDRAAAIVMSHAPLWCAASDFEEAACWPVTVAACNWRPRHFFAELRMPPTCKVAGSGRCSHGLCQKQELPKVGVLELLEEVVLMLTPSTACATALETIAWVNGCLGRNDDAMQAWERACRAGSARAQLDLGLRSYRSTGSASTVYHNPDLPPPAPEPDVASEAAKVSSAQSRLRAASKNPTLESLGLEGQVIKARALMVLGMMALDGDGSEQDDAAALDCLEGAMRAVRAGSKLHFSLGVHEPADDNGFGCQPSPDYARNLGQRLQEVEEDARESMQSIDRFKFFANGRP